MRPWDSIFQQMQQCPFFIEGVFNKTSGLVDSQIRCEVLYEKELSCRGKRNLRWGKINRDRLQNEKPGR
jgi:hypothetical protein